LPKGRKKLSSPFEKGGMRGILKCDHKINNGLTISEAIQYRVFFAQLGQYSSAGYIINR